MNTDQQCSSFGRGSSRFRFGSGVMGACGHVDIELSCFSESPSTVSVEWTAPLDSAPAHARHQILFYAERYLQNYLQLHPVGSLHVNVVCAGWDAERENDAERAAVLALHSAIRDAKLPPLPLYAPPAVTD